jgi:hypothetical protein
MIFRDEDVIGLATAGNDPKNPIADFPGAYLFA